MARRGMVWLGLARCRLQSETIGCKRIILVRPGGARMGQVRRGRTRFGSVGCGWARQGATVDLKLRSTVDCPVGLGTFRSGKARCGWVRSG
jgi:hypothetical protein